MPTGPLSLVPRLATPRIPAERHCLHLLLFQNAEEGPNTAHSRLLVDWRQPLITAARAARGGALVRDAHARNSRPSLSLLIRRDVFIDPRDAETSGPPPPHFVMSPP